MPILIPCDASFFFVIRGGRAMIGSGHALSMSVYRRGFPLCIFWGGFSRSTPLLSDLKPEGKTLAANPDPADWAVVVRCDPTLNAI